MRIEAVQNERRPYINPNTKQHELLSNVLANQHLRKPVDPKSLNTVNSLIFRNFSINQFDFQIHPLTSLLANLTTHRDENKSQQQSTLHSILTSTTRPKSPTCKNSIILLSSIFQSKFQLLLFFLHHHHLHPHHPHQVRQLVFELIVTLRLKQWIE